VRARRGAVWLVSLSLIVVGSQAAHALAYRLVYRESELRWRALFATGHAYLAYEPLLLAVVGAITLTSLVAVVVDETRGRRPRALPAWAFALLPPLGFVLQELLERSLAGVGISSALLMQPTFRLGLLLQIPFALAAYLTARLLLRAVACLGARLAPSTHVGPATGARTCFGLTLDVPRLSPLASGRCVRGPPLVSV
jgi:hypothetical protein